MSTWSKSIVKWQEDGHWCLSVPFTWLLPDAASFAAYHEGTVVGGPAVRLMPEWIGQYAEVDLGDREGIYRMHNPDCTVTTRGCRNSCPFCAVARIEGDYRELEDFTPGAVVTDSNLLQCSDAHFERVMVMLEGQRDVDFNGGLEARLFTYERARRIAALPSLKRVQLSWDEEGEEWDVTVAISTALLAGIPKRSITVRCLVNWTETPEEALRRMMVLRQRGVKPFPMRYQPLNCLAKNQYVAPQWAGRPLKQFVRFWARQNWCGGFEYQESGTGAQLPLF